MYASFSYSDYMHKMNIWTSSADTNAKVHLKQA